MDVDPPLEELEAIDTKTQHRYRVFKKNSPFLYDYLFTSSLLWPSLTVLFFPDLELPSNDANTTNNAKNALNFVTQRLLIGTFTTGQAIDAIAIDLFAYHNSLNQNINIDQWNYNQEKQEFELTTIPKTKLNRLQTIYHDGDVNKLAYMPQNPDVIASVNNVGDLLIYNRTKHSTIKKATDELKANVPELRLVEQKGGSCAEIFAVDWNKQKEGLIVSGTMDGQLNVHDIRADYDKRESGCIKPFWNRNDPEGINDVEWVPDHDSLFVSGDESGRIAFTDIRLENHSPISVKKTGNAINSISINPHESFCLATGDSNGVIDLWDLRNLNTNIRQISRHTDSITQLKWHPTFKSVLGSSSADRLVKLYNVANTTESLLFTHEGHMLGVNDFDWSKHVDWMVASVADDNSVHIWQPASHLLPTFG